MSRNRSTARMGEDGARQGRQRSDRRIVARLITPRYESAAFGQRSSRSSITRSEMRANRPKLEKRRQTLIHLGLRLSQGGLGAAHRDSAGANALGLIVSGRLGESHELGSRSNDECSY